MDATDDDEDLAEKSVLRLPLTPESEVSTESHGTRSKLKAIHSKRWKRVPDRQQRSRDEAFFWQAMNQIAGIQSPALHVVQLYQAFINTYLSLAVREAHGTFYRTFYWESPQNRSLQASRAGLCLTHLGLKYGDKRLLIEGRKRQITAIASLRQDLEGLKIQDEVDLGIIAASFTLGNTEVYNARTGPAAAAGYREHVGGLDYLFGKCGPENMDSKFAQALLHNTRQPSVTDSILKRKPNLFVQPEWIAAANKSPSLGASMTNWALQIPGLLEKVDKLDRDNAGALSLLSELSSLQKDLHDWLTKFYKLTNMREARYERCDIDQFPRFKDLCAGLAHVFPEMIEFPSFISATSHVYAWTCILLVRKAILTVSERYAHPSIWSKGLKAAMAASVTECAIDLCQSIAYLSLPEHLSCGILACSAPLYFASEWFDEQKSVQRLAWTRHVREFLERDGSLGGGSESRHRLNPPMFLYWMLPNHILEVPD